MNNSTGGIPAEKPNIQELARNVQSASFPPRNINQSPQNSRVKRGAKDLNAKIDSSEQDSDADDLNQIDQVTDEPKGPKKHDIPDKKSR